MTAAVFRYQIDACYDTAWDMVARTWWDLPPWARSPLTLWSAFFVVVLSCLFTVALVVQDMARRGEERQRADAQMARLQWQCHTLPRSNRPAECFSMSLEGTRSAQASGLPIAVVDPSLVQKINAQD